MPVQSGQCEVAVMTKANAAPFPVWWTRSRHHPRCNHNPRTPESDRSRPFQALGGSAVRTPTPAPSSLNSRRPSDLSRQSEPFACGFFIRTHARRPDQNIRAGHSQQNWQTPSWSRPFSAAHAHGLSLERYSGWHRALAHAQTKHLYRKDHLSWRTP